MVYIAPAQIYSLCVWVFGGLVPAVVVVASVFITAMMAPTVANNKMRFISVPFHERRDSSAPLASTNTFTMTEVGRRVYESYASFLTLCAYLLKVCRASIHPVSDKAHSRKPGFRQP